MHTIFQEASTSFGEAFKKCKHHRQCLWSLNYDRSRRLTDLESVMGFVVLEIFHHRLGWSKFYGKFGGITLVFDCFFRVLCKFMDNTSHLLWIRFQEQQEYHTYQKLNRSNNQHKPTPVIAQCINYQSSYLVPKHIPDIDVHAPEP